MKAPISHHILEIKHRLIYFLISSLITFSCAYFFCQDICYFLAKPLIDLGEIHFIYTDMGEAFITYVKISFFVTLYFCLPILLFHIWAFFTPGLYQKESRRLGWYLSFSFLFGTIGIIIAYFIILPVAWKFFFSFQSMDTMFQIELQPKINEYFLFITKIFFLFAISFQFPLYFLFFVEMGFVSINSFIDKRNYACVFSFIIAAILSPPDVMSQILLVIPLLILYEISIFFMKLIKEYTAYKKKTDK